MNVNKLKLGAEATSLVIMLVCCSIAVVGNYAAADVSEPIPGAPVDGEWMQTATRGLYNGEKSDEIHDNNNITIRDSGDGHFFYVTQRGVDCLAVRYGDTVLWQSSTEQGQGTVICNAYGNCMVVNEIYFGKGNAELTYVNASLYTKDGKIPGWFEYWEGESTPPKWANFNAKAIDVEGNVTDAEGRNLYFTKNNGPVFAAEIEQDIDGKKVTTPIHGVMVNMSDKGAFSAVAIDSKYNIWFIVYNGMVLTINSVLLNDSPSHLAGNIVGVEREYLNLNNSNIVDFPQPVIREGSKWEIVSSHFFTKDGARENPTRGEFTVEHTNGQVFTTSGKTESSTADVIGYTAATSKEGIYYIGIGMTAPGVFGLGMGYGTYDAHTGTMHLFVYAQAPESGTMIAEYEIKPAA